VIVTKIKGLSNTILQTKPEDRYMEQDVFHMAVFTNKAANEENIIVSTFQLIFSNIL
jgi:hypothetical protein